MKQYFIIDKVVKEPSDVFYLVKRVQQQKQDKITWKQLTEMKKLIQIIEQYEIRQYSEGEGIKYVEVIENYITEGKQYFYTKTSELTVNTIENKRVYNQNNKQDQNEKKIQVQSNDSLGFLYQKQGQMKEVIKDIRKINRERGDVKISNRKVFTESQIDKIVTYMRDELDINKYIFLVKFKQNQREVYPTWIPQERMLIYAPNLLEQYIKSRNIQL